MAFQNQAFAARRLNRWLISGESSGIPLEMHVYSRGSKRVSFSIHGIVSEMGHEHDIRVIGQAPTPFDSEPLVRLACLQQARLVIGLPLLSKDEEDAFLRTCPPAVARPRNRYVEACQGARAQARANIAPLRRVAA